MEEGHFSRTAAYVAVLRALGDRGLTTAEGFHDETACALLPERWARGFALAARIAPAMPRRARARMVCGIDLLVIRTLAIDAELSRAVAGGAEQVVILGAGFDGRAHRMAALEGARVFEVDHPSSQRAKRARVARLPQTCRELTYVPCDFERDALGGRLAAAGHRADVGTAWIWEGVTLYLDDDAIRSTLATIAERSAPKSALIMEYHDAEMPSHDPLYSLARKALLAWWSEPHVGARPQSQMRDEVEQARLHVERDYELAEWGAKSAGTRPNPMRRARLIVATPSA